MNINKKTEIFINDDNGNRILPGTFCVFTTNDGKCMCGVFKEISKRGSLTFCTEFMKGTDFGVMPKNIVNIMVAHIDSLGGVANGKED